jgi:hypothetical protein
LTTLTEEQREQFERDGYLVVDADLPDSLLEGIVADLDGLHAGEERTEDGVFYAWHRIGGAWRVSESVRSLALHPGIAAIVEELYDRKALPFQTLNFRAGSEQPAHSDTIHFNSMPRGYMCGAWAALEDIDMENGPVVYYPGSHKLPEITLQDVGPGADEDDYSTFVANTIERLDLKPKHATIRRGQVLLWASNLLHGGSPHRDRGRTRHSQVTHYFFEGCKYWSPLHSTNETHWLHPTWITADDSYDEVGARVKEIVRAAVPPGSKLLVVSRGDEELVRFDDLDASHFPQDEQGVWPGYYPADGQAAIAHLDELQAKGAEYIVLPETAFWWLESYPEFAEHLRRSCVTLVPQEEGCLVLALRDRNQAL